MMTNWFGFRLATGPPPPPGVLSAHTKADTFEAMNKDELK